MKGTRTVGIWTAIGVIIGATIGKITEYVEVAIIIGISGGLLIGLILAFRKTNSHDIH
jgi:hypothetical protein